jgi:hypothetical protein
MGVTTRGKVPDPQVESAVSVLTETSNGNLIRSGAVEHLAPGEDIRDVSFDNQFRSGKAATGATEML